MEQGIRIRTVLMLCLIMALWMPQMLSAQSCLPDGITLNTQAQIDSFPTLFPNCTEIEGDLTIELGDYTNLNGLISITKVHGDLEIRHSSILNSLSGLDNLTTVMGFLDIYNNSLLSSLAGLDNLEYIASGVYIEQNPSLTSLTGLDNLERIEERFYIWDNDALLSLSGLNKLGYIGTSFEIRKNEVLENIDDLEELDSIGEGFLIRENPSLKSIEGLSSLVYTGGGADIGLNPQLESLHGLENLTVVGHDLGIWGLGVYGNDILNNLSGLENISEIKSGLFIYGNIALQNLEGLQNLNTISGSLAIKENPVLSSLEQMINVSSIGSSLSIENNGVLKDLSGLDNIAASSIANLLIWENDSLSVCEVKSVCDYLAAPNGYVLIGDNYSGCNTQAEVELACESAGIGEDESVIPYSIYPNPFTTSTIIEYKLNGNSKAQISIYNALGEVVYQEEDRMMSPGTHEFSWSPHHLPAGLYYAVLRSQDGVSLVKMMKQ